jgi:hypothetical protein
MCHGTYSIKFVFVWRGDKTVIEGFFICEGASLRSGTTFEVICHVAISDCLHDCVTDVFTIAFRLGVKIFTNYNWAPEVFSSQFHILLQ